MSEDRYSKNIDAIHNRIAESAGIESGEMVMYYSAGPLYEGDMAAIDNLDDIAIKGRCQITKSSDHFWSEGNSEDFVSPMLNNPTWLEVSVLFDEAIHKTKDFHHQFLEGVRKIGELAVADELNPTGINLYQFSAGS